MARWWLESSSIPRARRCSPLNAAPGPTSTTCEFACPPPAFPSRKRDLNVNIHFYHQMAMATHGVRRGGSAAIDLAYVACGRLEAFWEFGLKPWDLAAGVLLVDEAGGRHTTMYGQSHRIGSTTLLADNAQIHDETIAL